MAPDTPGRLRSALIELVMPRSSAQWKRDRQLNIALHHSEVEMLKAHADAKGMRLVDYARARLLAMRAASATVVLPSKLERLNLEQLKRIGNNLNQIARQLNGLGQVVPDELTETLNAVRHLLRSATDDDR
ncbi:MAG: MobC family plasmid mobilization relaxosome protein [Alphaproteobacteria bacterium]|nr:MobC family plasmid mobilization relaxosome protein [Alphaproteobacteria bacterium]